MGHRGLIFQCGACRSLVAASAASVDVNKQRAGLTCEACGGTNWLPFAGAPGAGAGAHVVVDVEPGSAVANVAALAATSTSTALAPVSTAMTAPGSSFPAGAVFSAEQRDLIAKKLAALPAPEGERQRELADGFERLLGQWNSEGEHKTYLKRASMAGELAFAGQRYRQILDAAPGDAHAKRAQNEILTLAMVSLNAQRDMGGVAEDGKKKNAAIIALVLGLAVAAALFWLMPKLLRDLAGGDTMEIDGVESGDVGADPGPGDDTRDRGRRSRSRSSSGEVLVQ